MIEAIQDLTILNSAASTAAQRAPLGIGGVPNRSGNDGSIARFGWKAQNKSLTIFAGEAYNVEMGVTNDVFPNARDETPVCNQKVNEPNDITRTDTSDVRNQAFNNPLHMLPDWLEFAIFMRQLAPPEPAPFSASALRGRQLFGAGPANPGVGCFLCHTPSMVTGPRHETAALQNVEAHLYSDLLIHHMGGGLADNITQGLAEGDMFRTTPLWGIGQRLFFLHDGRTNDLLAAIEAHASGVGERGDETRGGYPPSEANLVIQKNSTLYRARISKPSWTFCDRFEPAFFRTIRCGRMQTRPHALHCNATESRSRAFCQSRRTRSRALTSTTLLAAATSCCNAVLPSCTTRQTRKRRSRHSWCLTNGDKGRDAVFRGLAVPGVKADPADGPVAIWQKRGALPKLLCEVSRSWIPARCPANGSTPCGQQSQSITKVPGARCDFAVGAGGILQAEEQA